MPYWKKRSEPLMSPRKLESAHLMSSYAVTGRGKRILGPAEEKLLNFGRESSPTSAPRKKKKGGRFNPSVEKSYDPPRGGRRRKQRSWEKGRTLFQKNRKNRAPRRGGPRPRLQEKKKEGETFTRGRKPSSSISNSFATKKSSFVMKKKRKKRHHRSNGVGDHQKGG